MTMTGRNNIAITNEQTESGKFGRKEQPLPHQTSKELHVVFPILVFFSQTAERKTFVKLRCNRLMEGFIYSSNIEGKMTLDPNKMKKENLQN